MHIMYSDESGDTGYPKTGDFPESGGPTPFNRFTRLDANEREYGIIRSSIRSEKIWP